MSSKSRFWVVLAVIGFIALVFLLAPPIRPPKARASRISGVNTLRSVTLTLTNTNTLPSAQPGIGK
jgi:asparagine N-glycosylation enzyme membrane subunit Stt3